MPRLTTRRRRADPQAPTRRRLLASATPSRRRDIVGIVVASIVFVVGAALAFGGDVGTVERRVFRIVNDLPGTVEVPLTVVMQGGTLGAVLLAVVGWLLARRRGAAVRVGIAGVGAWALAKYLKTVVGRGRPGDLLTDVMIRGAHVSGFGFPSGHSAVAASLAGAIAPYAPRSLRRVLWVTALTVALARLYVGAHLPLDIVGGLALGWFLSSLVGLALGDLLRAP